MLLLIHADKLYAEKRENEAVELYEGGLQLSREMPDFCFVLLQVSTVRHLPEALSLSRKSIEKYQIAGYFTKS